MTEKVVSFSSGKNRTTPWVAAPGDTNPSDATASPAFFAMSLQSSITEFSHRKYEKDVIEIIGSTAVATAQLIENASNVHIP